MKTLSICGLALAMALCAGPMAAQDAPGEAANQELYQTVERLDAELFDAYNKCQTEKFAALVSDDLEFYHDQSGLEKSKQGLIDALKKNICGKVTRELVPGTLKVYPLHGYGAVELGVHRFHHPGHDDTEPVGEAQFVQIWRQEDGGWKLTRVISFDHHALKKE